MELKDYITETAWQQRMSITEYLSSLIRSDMNAKQGGSPQ